MRSAGTQIQAGMVGTAVWVGQQGDLPYRVANTLSVRASRFFATATQYRQVVNNSWFADIVRRIGWQWHHWAIPNSTGQAAGGQLNQVTQAGWNLIPMPAFWNQYVSNGGFWYSATAAGVGTSPVWVPWSAFTFTEWLTETGDNDDSGQDNSEDDSNN